MWCQGWNLGQLHARKSPYPCTISHRMYFAFANGKVNQTLTGDEGLGEKTKENLGELLLKF